MYVGIKTEFELLCTWYLQMQLNMKAASMSLKNAQCSKYTQVQIKICLSKSTHLIDKNKNEQQIMNNFFKLSSFVLHEYSFCLSLVDFSSHRNWQENTDQLGHWDQQRFEFHYLPEYLLCPPPPSSSRSFSDISVQPGM